MLYGQSRTLKRAVKLVADQDHLPGAEGFGQGIALRKGPVPVQQESEKELRHGKGLDIGLIDRPQGSSNPLFEHSLAPDPAAGTFEGLALGARNMIAHRAPCSSKGLHSTEEKTGQVIRTAGSIKSLS